MGPRATSQLRLIRRFGSDSLQQNHNLKTLNTATVFCGMRLKKRNSNIKKLYHQGPTAASFMSHKLASEENMSNWKCNSYYDSGLPFATEIIVYTASQSCISEMIFFVSGSDFTDCFGSRSYCISGPAWIFSNIININFTSVSPCCKRVRLCISDQFHLRYFWKMYRRISLYNFKSTVYFSAYQSNFISNSFRIRTEL